MQLSILEPKGVLWQGKAKEVILPTEEGEVSVLDFHQPFFMRLRKGDVRFSGEERISIQGGLAFMQSNELTLFVDALYNPL